ncbi:uncharacterized protein SPPG_08639 [Spizellomyces punctatus DAOM BR117]|uniref:Magnesium and cobalt transporter CorA n=1 Tax=Spizellomyces punctatus (strain DAOM BR117) TaxID=645134 RepID=A0A0L0H4Z4_SPIPD|nr:uncharacterized protein SPPG_08639 [Spizellomyces punctatus DAOM BR117]KNC96044.1 hypothetical protein SPPG_08639 [Spizellomyces punctatus DAOM BR117]|eukprot:XP_016604084.1 hypothetical protein SPPG_08639 [Spizellomyces punctatus DAOM BR117]
MTSALSRNPERDRPTSLLTNLLRPVKISRKKDRPPLPLFFPSGSGEDVRKSNAPAVTRPRENVGPPTFSPFSPMTSSNEYDERSPLLQTQSASQESTLLRRVTTYGGLNDDYDRLCSSAVPLGPSLMPSTPARLSRPRSISAPGNWSAPLTSLRSADGSDEEIVPVFLTHAMEGPVDSRRSLALSRSTRLMSVPKLLNRRPVSIAGDRRKSTIDLEESCAPRLPPCQIAESPTSLESAFITELCGVTPDAESIYESESEESDTSSSKEEHRGADWLNRSRPHELARELPGERPSASDGSERNPFLVEQGPENEVRQQLYMDFSALEANHAESCRSGVLNPLGSTEPFADLVSTEAQCVFYSSSVGGVRARSFQDFAGETGHWLRDRAAEGTFWIDFHKPSEHDLDLASKVFSIHPLTIEDICNGDIEREKCEAYNDYLSITVRSVDLYDEAGTDIEAATLSILVYPDCILSFHSDPLPHIPAVIQRLTKIHNLTERKFKQHSTKFFHSAWICYLLIDEILNSIGPLTRHLEREADDIENLVLYSWNDEGKLDHDTDMLRRIHGARKRAIALMRLMGDKPRVLKGVAKKGMKWKEKLFGDELGLYFESLQDRTLAILQGLRHFDDMLTRCHSEYLAEINISLTAASKRTNELMRKTTAVVTLLVPLGVLTGLMGMNVRIPGQGREDLTFFGIYGFIMCGLLGWMYRLAIKWHWFSDTVPGNEEQANDTRVEVRWDGYQAL